MKQGFVVESRGGYGDCESQIHAIYADEKLANEHADLLNKKYTRWGSKEWVAEVRVFNVLESLPSLFEILGERQ